MVSQGSHFLEVITEGKQGFFLFCKSQGDLYLVDIEENADLIINR